MDKTKEIKVADTFIEDGVEYIVTAVFDDGSYNREINIKKKSTK